MQESPINIDKSIVLVGLMGCGKSALGKRLAKALDIEFIDIDKKIEEQEKCTITDIFESKGESYFRDLEHATLRQYLEGVPAIIATGGGAFIQERNQKLIQELGVSLWIKVAYDILLERVSRKKTRPLLERGDKATILKELMEERYPIYEKAHITVETSNKPHNVMVEKLIAAIKHNKEQH